MPTGFFFLGAEVDNPAAELIPDFVSPNARNRHDRLDMHFGRSSAQIIKLSEALGPMSAGTTLEDALRYLMDKVIFHESYYGGQATLDATTEAFFPFWRDNFDRVEEGGLGIATGRSSFGPFDWQRYDTDGTLAIAITGFQAELFPTQPSINTAEFVGYPTFTSGELMASIYTFTGDSVEWMVSWKPWRDDISQLSVWLWRVYIAGHWFMSAGIGDLISTSLPMSIEAEDFNAHFLLGAPGEEIAVKLWNWEDPEPDDWNETGTLPLDDLGTPGPTPTMRFQSGGDAGFPIFVNNFRALKTDTDPVRIYHCLKLDAEVAV